MTLNEFMETTDTRLPQAKELISVCEAIGIRFGTDAEGRPALKVNSDNQLEGTLLAKLIRREPWRSQVLAMTGLDRQQEAAKPCREFLWRNGQRYTEDPRDAEFGTDYQAGAWWWRVEGETVWQPVPGRGGEHEQPPAERSTP